VTHAVIWYRAVADLLVVRWGDDASTREVVGPGAVVPCLRDDGSCAGLRIRDFSTEWPRVNREQIALITSPELLRVIDERHAQLQEAPSCMELDGVALGDALAVGFDVELDVA
jgi:hypothetical protein